MRRAGPLATTAMIRLKRRLRSLREGNSLVPDIWSPCCEMGGADARSRCAAPWLGRPAQLVCIT